jgi:hypothetical protein
MEASGASEQRTTAASGAELDHVRRTIRDLLTSADGFANLPNDERAAVANSLVRIATKAMDLEHDVGKPAPAKSGVARALDAGQRYSGVATDKIADTTRRILNAVSFPRFVNELLVGVFKALLDTNQQQLQQYVDLIKAVASTTEGFRDANVGLDGARQWLAERFPANFAVESLLDPGEKPEEGEPTVELRLRPGASMPTEAALRTGLGLGPDDPVPSGSPESLLPLVRTSLAKNRHQMLSTMVMLGLQRIVIDSGRIHAAMRFHIDTRSAAEEQSGSTFNMQNEIAASGSFAFGPWGVSASAKNTIGYVSTQSAQTTEETNTDLDLNSSVELVFKTDYVPLDRLATGAEVSRIKVNTLNPDAEARQASDERKARSDDNRARDADRRQQLGTILKPQSSSLQPPTAPKPPGEPKKEEPKKKEEPAPKKKEEPAPKKESKSDKAPTDAGKSATSTGGGNSTPPAQTKTQSPAS